MSYDLVFGRLRRDWSIGGSVPLPKPEPELSSSAMLEQEIKAKKPEAPASPSLEKMIKEKVREASPEAMSLYEKYRPTYKNKSVVLRMKI